MVERGRSSTDLVRDRRRAERYAAAEDQAWIGWWEGRLYRKAPAVLVDISLGGAKLIVENGPPRRVTVWICVAGSCKTEWVEGVSVDVTRNLSGSAEVRIAFREPCPYAFFKVVVYGVGSDSVEAAANKVADPQGRNWS